MSFPLDKFRRLRGRSRTTSSLGDKIALGRGIVALMRAAARGKRSVIRIDGKEVAVVPLRDLRHLERLLEQEEEREKELDRLDVEEAERRLEDPSQIPIPFEQALRESGLDDV